MDAGQITKMMSLEDMFLVMLLDYVKFVMSLDATISFVIGVQQVWWLSINLQSNKVIVLGQISLIFFHIKVFFTQFSHLIASFVGASVIGRGITAGNIAR
jgi:hypothetical protein